MAGRQRPAMVKGVLQHVQEALLVVTLRGALPSSLDVGCDVTTLTRDVRTKNVAGIGVPGKIQ